MKKNPFSLQPDTQNSRIKNYAKRKWQGDSFRDDAVSSGQAVSLHVNLATTRIIFGLFLVLLGALFARVITLQVAKGEEYKVAAEENRIRNKILPAPRGIIFDRNGTPLVSNVPNFVVTITPADIPKGDGRASLVKTLAPLIMMSEEELQTFIAALPQHSFEPAIVKEKLPYEQALKLEIASASLPGVDVELTSSRLYKDPEAFAHLLGYVGKISKEELNAIRAKGDTTYETNDLVGKTGLESYYEQEVKGVHGKKQVEVDSLGKEKKVTAEADSRPGENLETTIDEKLQTTLAHEIMRIVANSRTITGASAVAIDPRNGEVLAIVSAPSFDNNAFVQGLSPTDYEKLTQDPRNPLFYRAVSGEYPSGSTIKPLIALAALEDGVITERTTFLSTGGIQIDKWFFPDWKAGGHGVTDVRKAIAESVNTFFYEIGGGDETFTGLGVEKIRTYLQRYGLNRLLGIDLAGEATGFLPSMEWKEQTKKEQWYIGDTYHLAIGQGDLLVTPLQVANYTAMIANGGTIYQPHIVKRITDEAGKPIKDIAREAIAANVASAKNIGIIQSAMRQGVISGSSKAMQSLSVSSAGKTGTAQWASDKPTHAWFTAFAPYEHPEIAITVMVESGGEGHQTALPVALKALQEWFSR